MTDAECVQFDRQLGEIERYDDRLEQKTCRHFQLSPNLPVPFREIYLMLNATLSHPVARGVARLRGGGCAGSKPADADTAANAATAPGRPPVQELQGTVSEEEVHIDAAAASSTAPVSYTHLTLPTICSV